MEDSPWLEKICPPEFNHGWLSRIYWQRFKLPKQALKAAKTALINQGYQFK